MKGGHTVSKHAKKYIDVPTTIKTIWREEGWRGFYRGTLSNI